MSSWPSTCKAAVITEYNKPIEILDVKMPEKLQPGSMLAKIEAATVCGTDVHLWEGHFASMGVKLPCIPGHEMVGSIVAFGEGVSTDSTGQELKVGDRILWAHGRCGRCYECKIAKRPHSCKNSVYYMSWPTNVYPYIMGGFAEYCYVHPSSGTLKIPDGVKNEWASAVGCALRSVVEGYTRMDAVAPISWLDTVVVQGSGPLGLFVTAIASTKGPKQIIVIGGPDQRLEVARKYGANHTISIVEHSDPNERIKMVMELTGGRGADVLFEVSGAHGAFTEGLGLLAMNGRYIVLGPMGGPETPVRADILTKKNVLILGNFSADIDAYFKAMKFVEQNRDRFNWDLMFSNTYKLSEINTVMERMQRFEEVKPIILPII